ncbi:MAG: diguanylate cyclase [Armatimonadota bacterium]|nr:diguanylate cyclase [Armatimonadota bacterium]
MKNERLATITFALLWVTILTVFSFGSHYANALVVHALLAILTSIKGCYLFRQDGGRSSAGTLTYAAAINFGIAGGLLIGAITATCHAGPDGKTVIAPRNKFVARFMGGAVAGALSAIIYAKLNALICPANFLSEAVVLLSPAIVCFAIITFAEAMTTKLLAGNSLRERLELNAPPMVELASGIALALGVRVLYELYSWDPMLLVLPIVYLAKQTYMELLPPQKSIPSSALPNKLADVYLSTLQSIVTAIDAKDRFARSHTANVESISVAIAQEMGLSPTEVEGVRTAALLHDVGKLGVPEHVLLKPGKFDSHDMTTIQTHSALGQKILDSVSFPWPVGAMIRSHHERWDGTGYPDGLKGEEIPLGARILAVADVYDAMTSKRSYRPSYSPQQALDYIRKASGTQFDPAVFRAFERAIAKGNIPGLNNEEIAEISASLDTKKPGKADKPKTPQTSVAEELSRASHEFLAMFEIAQTASTSLNLDEVLNLIANKISNMIACSTCVIFLKDEESNKLLARIAVGVNADYFEGGRTIIGQGLTGVVAETGEGLIAVYDRNDVMLRQLFGRWIELKSVMIVPITHGDKVIGTINLYDTKDQAFSEEDFHILCTVAPQVGKAIQNALLFERTKESALTDALTGLHNARYLFMHLEQELSRAKRTFKPVSVLGLDLDNFKPINDTFGHQQGDIVLSEIGKVFLSQVRDYDLVCRCAGDEFIIVLPETEKHEAIETAERIKAAVEEYVPHLPHDKPFRLGVSIGVATYPEDGSDVRTLIAKADEAMYADKRRRKNMCAA